MKSSQLLSQYYIANSFFGLSKNKSLGELTRETQEKATKISRKRKRIKQECLVCHHQFDDDYRSTHKKTFHSALISQHKAIPYKVANAPKNPFEAAKKAYQKTEQSHTLISNLPSSITAVAEAVEDSVEPNDGTQEIGERSEIGHPQSPVQ